MYVTTRKRARELHEALRKARIRSDCYHAGRKDSARERAQSAFFNGDVDVLVATSAFGMGIDVRDVRLVLHADAPASLSAYYQQAGRAGRDGAPAECVLLFSGGDVRTHARVSGNEESARAAFAPVEAYAWANECRMRKLVSHFGQELPRSCGRCDVCRDPDGVERILLSARRALNVSAQARRDKAQRDALARLDAAQLETVLSCVDGLKKPVGRRLVVKTLRGSSARDVKKKGLRSNPAFGALRESPDQAIFRAIDELLDSGKLAPKGKKYPTLWVSGKPVRPRGAVGRKPKAKVGLEAALRALRKREAKRRRIKPYQVFADRTLLELMEKRPRSTSELLSVWGMGEERANKYGKLLLDEIAAHPADPELLSRSAG